MDALEARAEELIGHVRTLRDQSREAYSRLDGSEGERGQLAEENARLRKRIDAIVSRLRGLPEVDDGH